jgi:hypothetical protein
MPDVCSVCGKDVVRLEVCEGEKLFHFECYVLSKRRGPKPEPLRDPTRLR